MSRKIKYNKEVKLEIIKKYIDGVPVDKLNKDYGISRGSRKLIFRWVNKFKNMGEDAFEPSNNNRNYSKGLKLLAINEYLQGTDSMENITHKYNISSSSILTNWIKKYNSHIEIQDYDPKPEVYMAKSRKVSYEEKIEIVEYCVNNGMDYKNTAAIFNTTYAQVFNWVKKHKLGGNEALSDNRGRRKEISELSNVDKQIREIERLKRELMYKQMEVDALKKFHEIERRLENKKIKK